MAVVVTDNPSALRIKFKAGTNAETGKTIFKSRTYSAIKADAISQDMFDVANVLGSLQDFDIVEVQRIDFKTLSA